MVSRLSEPTKAKASKLSKNTASKSDFISYSENHSQRFWIVLTAQTKILYFTNDHCLKVFIGCVDIATVTTGSCVEV